MSEYMKTLLRYKLVFATSPFDNVKCVYPLHFSYVIDT
jgi:hypothetical protein